MVKDFFTPCNYNFLNQLDLDLGSAGPVLLPVTPGRIVSGGKEGVLYVLSPRTWGNIVAQPHGAELPERKRRAAGPGFRCCRPTMARPTMATSTARRCSGRDPTRRAFMRGARTAN